MYQSSYISALKNTDVAFVLDIEDSNFTQYTLEYVRSNFTDKPPPCVGEDFVQPSPYSLLFRQSK